MAQQTAVEYLLEKLYTEYMFAFSGTIVDQAKEMEKDQIKKAYNDGAEQMVESKYEGMHNYYNLRYGSNNQI